MMQSQRFGLSVLLLVLAGIASLAMSAFGLFSGAWGGFWSGANTSEAFLALLFWLLPAISILAFGSYFLSKVVGVLFSWAISIGSMITIFTINLQSCLAGKCTTTNPVKIALGVFLLPHIWILLANSITLYLAAVSTDGSLHAPKEQAEK
jgi:hypothetical protein